MIKKISTLLNESMKLDRSNQSKSSGWLVYNMNYNSFQKVIKRSMTSMETNSLISEIGQTIHNISLISEEMNVMEWLSEASHER